VNDELGALRDGLAKGFMRLAPGGRMAVIAFHSLEDRIVKQFFKDMQTQHGAIILTKKPLTPGARECRENTRSRSAKLRMLRKCDATVRPSLP
jgi:16S rRNA (cytosine1402-N4)-methyltransferase